ncbi:DUF3489 domain-containing protein [Emcibacter sp. SYSU 3D8]|uniref:DUF3489 domain-containing protein n=1 Tax=Emcibacter sp. SYSU 3D8 TaxID=3133969 RepID=UPI0031FEB55C
MLTDTQLVILGAAAQRDGHEALPLPDSLKGGAAHKVVGALLSRGLIEEVLAPLATDHVWRTREDGQRILLRITDAGLAAIGIEPADTSPTGDADAPEAPAATKTAPADEPAPTARTPREGTKQAALIAMLRSPEGATIAEVVAATGWQQHTVRGAIAGALKKKLGLEVVSEKVEGRGRVYRIAN